MKVELKDISKIYENGVKALDKISLKIRDGEVMGLIGSSGSGKSTLLKIVAGIIPPSSGTILFDDEDITFVPMERRRVGLVFQDVRLFSHMNIRNNVGYAPFLRGHPKANELVEWLLSFIQARRLTRRYPDELSRGMQQKVSLVRTLASEPKILLLDEPLSGVDSRVKMEMIMELRKMLRELRITTLYVTHDQWEVTCIAERIAVLEKGRLVQVGTPEELHLAPKNLHMARFMGGECNVVKGTGDGTRVKCENGIVLPFKMEGEVMVAIKPEAFIPHGEIEAEVIEREFQGAFSRLLLNIGGHIMVARMLSRDVPGGKVVRLGLDLSKVFVFRR